MIEVLQFIFQDFWHFIGTFLLLMAIEAVSAVAQYLLQEDKSLLFDYQGHRYRLSVVPEPPKEKT